MDAGVSIRLLGSNEAGTSSVQNNYWSLIDEAEKNTYLLYQRSDG